MHKTKKTDVIILGAGIIGVSVALQLQRRGKTVILIDRRDPGEETSYGNAGLIERSSAIPYGFPRDLLKILKYGTNQSADVHFDWLYLPRIAPWLWRFWKESSPKRLTIAANDMWPLIERSVTEHELLMQEAGAVSHMNKNGWIEIYHSQKALNRAYQNAVALDRFNLQYDRLDSTALKEREPYLANNIAGGIHWLDPATVPDPGNLVKTYAQHFVKCGGAFLRGDASHLRQTKQYWQAVTDAGNVEAPDVVVALGPWSDVVYRPLGYEIPLGLKRGYHVHFNANNDAHLNHPIVDVESGFVIAPMTKGIRLTTGIEFADRDSPPTPLQLDKAEPFARKIFPLKSRIEPTPWVGSRPCLPDMRPIIGPATYHKGLWFAFGHNHHGLTLGPITGRLLSEMITNEPPFTNPLPYSVDRFNQ